MQDAIANDGEVLDPEKGQEKGKDFGTVLLINVQEGCQETTAQMHVDHATERFCKGKDSRHSSFPCEKLRNQSS